MPTDYTPGRRIVSYASPRAYAAKTWDALGALGYDLVTAPAVGPFDDRSWGPALRIADERQLDRIPDLDADGATPLVVLTGSRPRSIEDPRLAGSLRRPAELHRLYPLLQTALETHPRQAPRADSRLSARAIVADRRCLGAIVSISGAGCLFRTSTPLEPGTRLSLQIALPPNQIISTRAECVSSRPAGIGLAFQDASEHDRLRIHSFVIDRLTGCPSAAATPAGGNACVA